MFFLHYTFMKYVILLVGFCCCSYSVNENKTKTAIVEAQMIVEEKESNWMKAYDSTKSYLKLKSELNLIRNQVAQQTITDDSLSQLFSHLLVYQIIPYWYGTSWDFEGHTSTPLQGDVACGYFVSTTLRDLGINLNRYKLAQQSPLYEAKSLQIEGVVNKLTESSIDDYVSKINDTLKEGIYFLGFGEGHVGFLYKEKSNIYIIHSNYMKGEVMVEPIEKSDVFNSYSFFYIVALSTNKILLNKWLNQSVLKIITP